MLDELNALLAFVVALAGSAALTPVVRRIALRADLVDRPRNRGLSDRPVPLLGGIAILAGVVLAAVLELPDTAVTRAKEALDLLGAEQGAEQGSAWWAYADGLALRGDADAANDAYRRAVELMAENRSWREAAQACRAWGKMLRNAGRESEALDVLERATDLAVRDDPVDTSRKR